MDTSSVEFIDYYGYDMDHVEMFLDPKDSDFAPEFQSDSFGLHIRQSKSDPSILSKSNCPQYGYDNISLQEALFLCEWKEQVGFWDSVENIHVEHDCSMLTLEGLRSHYNSCLSCGVNWSDNHVSLDCSECGGYAMQRPCPECEGVCRSVWNRDISATHSSRQAKWKGHCQRSIMPKNERENCNYSYDLLSKKMKANF